MRQFASSPITSLVDEKPRYNLGESCGRDLSVAEILTEEDMAALGRVTAGYGSTTGGLALRQQIAARLGIPAGQVLITQGAAGALLLLGLLFGDGEIVVGVPCYPPTLDAVRGVGTAVRTFQSRFEHGYRIEMDDFRRALSPRTTLVMLSSPQNPSATSIPEPDIEAILDRMSRLCPEAYLLIDETFREAVYGDMAPRGTAAGTSPRIITCASLSKAYGVPGLRIGWLTAPNVRLYEQLRLAKFNAAICCGSVDEFLALRLLPRADEVLAQRGQVMAGARDVAESWVERHSDQLRWIRPEAGAYCCLELNRDVFTAADIDRLLARIRQGGTAITPGPWLGDTTHVLRLGLAYEPLERLQQGLKTISAALSDAGTG